MLFVRFEKNPQGMLLYSKYLSIYSLKGDEACINGRSETPQAVEEG